ncbi:hypothetical protein [Cyanobium sp. NIES-981]|uniref:hypothetical protein n=1 Tax=Cyanobium sp. NIES-981 TaxID=1851505 RepID=UPI0007DDDE77|nr:hypothetical protein [Cyanobium sp. NIES-981]SBO43076.1 conserved membrane protein of unknown function [Cyanobium sp. NIES-981]
MRLRSVPPSLLWGSAQAGSSLTLAATAWLVSGLTASPLLNSLLPALATLPVLLPLQRRATGYGLQLAAALALLGVGLGQLSGALPQWVLLPISLLAVLLFGLGLEMSQLPLQRRLLQGRGSTIEGLRRGTDLGGLLGNLLTALLFPAALQFAPALLLLLPLGVPALGSGDTPAEPPRTAPAAPAGQAIPFNRRCALQGLLFGGLFALLPLWVREVGAGNCFDFGMVLAAYGLGRGCTGLLPVLAGPLRYGLMAALLAVGQLTPGWATVLLFLPLGALAAACDGALVEGMGPLGDAPLRWQVLQRSGAIGGLAGSLGMGLLSQALGLGLALPLQLLAFLGVAWPLGRQPLRPSSP